MNEWLSVALDKSVSQKPLNVNVNVVCGAQDCMEEINLFGENKGHLKQLGEQLISASSQSRETEVHHKIQDVTDRWQHLFDHIETR